MPRDRRGIRLRQDAVSYTHLDVYKRQAWRRTVDPATRAEYAQALSPILHGLDVATGARPPSDLGVTALDAHTLRVQLGAPTPYPVSYTHLDVYKRQYAHSNRVA